MSCFRYPFHFRAVVELRITVPSSEAELEILVDVTPQGITFVIAWGVAVATGLMDVGVGFVRK
jgi:hypothetical protein